jgi:hypothetical protein
VNIYVGKVSTSFCEQKKVKNFFESGAWAEARPLPQHRTCIKKSFLLARRRSNGCTSAHAPDSKKFLRAFFQKALLLFPAAAKLQLIATASALRRLGALL